MVDLGYFRYKILWVSSYSRANIHVVVVYWLPQEGFWDDLDRVVDRVANRYRLRVSINVKDVWMKYIREKKKVNLKVPLRLRKERWMFVSTYEPGRKKKENDNI